MKKLIICLLTSALFFGTAEAARQIQFAKGKTGTSVSGKIKGDDSVDYQLRASAGQTMTVDFKGSKGAAYFNVLPPGSTGEAIFVGSSAGDHFQGVLPSDGDYILRVYLMGGAKDSGKPVNYSLKVNIKSSGKTAKAASADSGTGVAEKACLDAVAKKVGVDVSKLSVIDVKGAEAGIGVTIKVPDATAPWSCLSDKKGKVQGASFTGSEGDL
ncbi:MAG: hypothetical protein NTV43_17305 [Methylococcales bacterium]|nr:hypothetical protein [Methylococcales bacterium]